MRIVYLMGKSASGKDTIYKKLLETVTVPFSTVVLYTTRPMRFGEKEGVQYHFIDETRAQDLRDAGRVIEERTYHTIHGPWTYMTVDDGQFSPEGKFLMIGTLESYNSIRQYFGDQVMLPVYLELDAGVRLMRALTRERKQQEPKYAEMCRRFLADEEDFSEEKLQQAGIVRRFQNENLEQCLAEIQVYVENGMDV